MPATPWISAAIIAAGLVLTAPAARAADRAARVEAVAEGNSPWLVMPTVSSDPKLGTSLGVFGAYLHYFDEKSQASMFGAAAQYTTTDSKVGAVFAKTSFGEDHHRLIALAAGGVIKNDYDDYLGSGVPLKTTDDLHVLVSRYLYRIHTDWFIGAQAVSSNYLITGETALDEQVLDVLGLKGFESVGIGAVVMHDSRDNEYSPLRGWVLNLNNIAYRKSLGGSYTFDVYRIDLKGFWEHGDGNVFAVRQNNHWSVDAPPSAYASVILRGYKQGQYLGKNMSSLEGEERLRIAESWGATLFAGVACLYGDGNDCSDGANRYPSGGAGLQYIIKPKERMVASLEYAAGKADNYGIYLKFGYGF
jgi:hypothetical protein